MKNTDKIERETDMNNLRTMNFRKEEKESNKKRTKENRKREI